MVTATGLVPPAKYGKYMTTVSTLFILASVLWSRLRGKFERSTLARVDVFGMFLLLASSVLLVFALEEGGARCSWNSAAVISSLVLALVLGIVFVVWETFLDKTTYVQEPVFPPSIVKNRLPAAMLA
ncbi:hypothetical protein V1517DRAFT_335621 [Lipomyces orientalis]|uniref:Uncharacterized protein n=1 Tax=Lipomyces orientalis TaxID=1233043 RepID=A0ACC3TY09_9ASCO